MRALAIAGGIIMLIALIGDHLTDAYMITSILFAIGFSGAFVGMNKEDRG